MGLRKTAIIYLYKSINEQLFITNVECVYCAVQAGSLHIIQFIQSLKG
jgi:hypothetical protein